MPVPSAMLASVLVITFIGTKKLPKQWLKSMFRVCCCTVYEALIWLKANNKLYSGIVISEDQLQDLPEDGVPMEIMAIVCCEEDNNVAL